MTASAQADVLYSCDQSTGYQTPLADTRHPTNFSKLTADQQNVHFSRWLGYYCSGDYMRDIANTVDVARSNLAARAQQPGEKLALVLDIDETSLTNEPSILGDDLRSPAPDENFPCDDLKAGCGYTFWERKGASAAIQPTLELFREARARGVSIFFITGRFEEAAPVSGQTRTMRQATADNLNAVGYGGYSCLFLKPQAGSLEQADTPECADMAKALANSYAGTAPYKQAVRQAIIAHGYKIVLNMGDQRSDLGVTPDVDDQTSEVSVLLPDPFY